MSAGAKVAPFSGKVKRPDAEKLIKELRGDARREAIDIYNHIDKKELKETYLACVSQLGI